MVYQVNKILKKLILIGLPVIATSATAAGIYLMLDNKSNPEVVVQNPPPQSDPRGVFSVNEQTEQSNGNEQDDSSIQVPRYDVFPNLSSYDFYKYLEIGDDGAYFTDDFIAAVINKVVKDTIITDGELHYSYNRVSSSVLKVTFVWVRTNGDSYSKVYTFELSDTNN